ncbi:8374_t:CDS:2, partial [Racocetra persica]
VIIIVGGFEIPKNLKNILEKAIREVKAKPEILKQAINDVKELPEISEHQQYFQEVDQQLKDLEKVLKIKDFHISDLAFNILFNIKTENFLFIEKANNFDLESIFSNEIDLLTGDIDKYLKFLPKWNSYCTKIINQFEDFNNFINNIKDSLFYFEIQEKLLTKMGKIREELCDKSVEIDEHEAKKKNSFIRQKYYEECAAKRLKLFNSISIQNILDFLKKLNYELEQTDLVDLVEVYKKSELCLKDCCLDYIIENLSKI